MYGNSDTLRHFSQLTPEEKKNLSSLQNNAPLSILHHVRTLTTIVRLTTATIKLSG